MLNAVSRWQKIFPSLDFQIYLILLGLLFISLGNYILVPYIGFYLVHLKKISLTDAALIISLRSLSQRALPLFAGSLMTRFGTKAAILTGVLSRALSFLILIFFTSLGDLYAFSILNGFGSAIYQPSAKTALAFMAPADKKATIFGLRNIFINLGASLGPLMGALAFVSFHGLVIISFLIYLVALILFLVFLKSESVVKTSFSKKINYFKLIKNSYIRKFIFMQIVFFAIYAQLEFLIPLHLNEYIGKNVSGLVLSLNAILVVLLQPAVSIYFTRSKKYILFGFVALFLSLLGSSLLLSVLHYSLIYLLILALGIMLFTLGELIFTLISDIYLTEVLPAEFLGHAFSLMSSVSAIGILLGNFLSSSMYRAFSHLHFIEIYFSGFLVLILCLLTIYLRGKKYESYQYASNRPC